MLDFPGPAVFSFYPTVYLEKKGPQTVLMIRAGDIVSFSLKKTWLIFKPGNFLFGYVAGGLAAVVVRHR